jgi:hypothetical protein
MSDPAEHSEAIIKEIEMRSITFVHDNIKEPTSMDFLMIKNAMLVGASVALEREADEL